MDRLQAISLKFTLEEILVLLETLGMTTYAGLDTSAIDQLNERERTLVLDVARRGLIAREMLNWDEAGQLQVGRMAQLVLGVSLAPAHSVLVTAGRSQTSADTFLFHTAEDVYATHDIEQDGTHQFYLMLDGQTWRQAILAAAGLDGELEGEGGDGPALSLPSNALNDAFDKAQSGTLQESATVLESHGLETPAANRLAAVLSKGVTFATVTSVEFGNSEQRASSSFVKGGDMCWRLDMTGDEAEARQVEMVPISFNAAREEISALIG